MSKRNNTEYFFVDFFVKLHRDFCISFQRVLFIFLKTTIITISTTEWLFGYENAEQRRK